MNECNVDENVIDVVHNEGNSDLDPSICIIDTSCPSSVCGRKVFDAIVESRGDDGKLISRRKENKKFQFGPSEVYTSNMNYDIEVEIGKLKDKVRLSVVEADIPFLLGVDYQSKWDMVFNMAK